MDELRHPVPVFPLPDVVLFPHARLPLHVFELRYRTLVREALSGPRVIAMALLAPGWERDYRDTPDFHPIGCLGRIDRVEWLPNDCYNLELVGLTRVRFLRVEREFPYRTARVEALPQHPYPEDDPLVKVEQQALRETFERLLATYASPEGLQLVPSADVNFESLVNGISQSLDLEPRVKLRLLEEDSVIERGRRVREWIERRLRSASSGGAVGGEHN
jgi:hypothetical protein